MATTTTNFGWDIPQSTDLVKDGATAIAALGQDIDTALVDLKGGTTGQVLAKASGTDLDFSWVAQDDSNAIQNAIVDAKGDLIAATAADTPARLGVGTNGQVLTADSTAATGLAWATPTAGGGFTSLASGSLSGTSTTVSITTTGYKQLVLYVKDVTCGTDWFPALRLNSDSGTNYNNIYQYMNSSSTVSDVVEDASSAMYMQQMEATVADNFQVWTIFDPANTGTWKFATYQIGGQDRNGGYNCVQQGYGQWRNTAAITGVTFFTFGATYSTGTYEIYGVK